MAICSKKKKKEEGGEEEEEEEEKEEEEEGLLVSSHSSNLLPVKTAFRWKDFKTSQRWYKSFRNHFNLKNMQTVGEAVIFRQ